MHKNDLLRLLRAGCEQVFGIKGADGQAFAFKEKPNSNGFTLVELIVVISIIASLTLALGFSFSNWMGTYKVEKAVKELYVDLMNVRGMAMTRNCEHFMDFNFPAPSAGYGTYRIAEDTNGDGEGDADADGIIDAAGHTFIPSSPKTVDYPITFGNGTNRIINFDRRGIVQPRGQAAGGTICFFTDKNPDYDCIVISQTRIIMGKLTDISGACNSSNCAKK